MTEHRTEAEAIASITQATNPLVAVNERLQLIHQNYAQTDIEQYLPNRSRPRGTFKTPRFIDFKSFIDSYEIANTPIFIHHDAMLAVGILNMDIDIGEQGHCDHKAILTLEKTVAWSKLLKIADGNSRFDQRGFATFLEDWSDLLIAMSPDHEPIAPRDAMHAVRNMVIDANVSSNTSLSNTSESRSSLQNIEAKSKDGKLPAYFAIKDSCYIGLEVRQIMLRLVINTNDNKPTFSLQIVKQELIEQALTQEFKEIVLELLPDNPVRIGSFNP